MATVATRFRSPPPAPPPRPHTRRRAAFPAGAARSRVRRNSLCNLSCLVSRAAKASVSGAEPSAGGKDPCGSIWRDLNDIIDGVEVESTTPGASFLAKVAVAIGVTAMATVISLFMKQPSSGPSFCLPQIVDALAQSDAAAATIGYTFSLFGKKIIIPEYTPGLVYFWLLMAAGFGLFISEEAPNVWSVLCTVLWVYWGVCISDMIPFYLGKLLRQTRAAEDISSKIGIGKEKALSISRVVQKYGNLIGFGYICVGRSLLWLSIYYSHQLAVGFFLRERLVVALASVAAAVGIWTVFPYAAAACTALFLYLRRDKSSS